MNLDECKDALDCYMDDPDCNANLVVSVPSGIGMEIKRMVLEIPNKGQSQLVLEVIAK